MSARCEVECITEFDAVTRINWYTARCQHHGWSATCETVPEVEERIAQHRADYEPAPAEPDRKARLVHLAGELGLDPSVGALMDGVVAEILRALDEREADKPKFADESTLTDSGQSEPSSTEVYAEEAHCLWCAELIRWHVLRARWVHGVNRVECNPSTPLVSGHVAEPNKSCGKLAENGIGQTAACTFPLRHRGDCSWWNL